MIEVSGFCTSAATLTTRSPWSRARSTSGSYEVDPPRRDLLDRRGRIRRLPDLHVEARLLEVAARLGRVDAGVVRVREVVQHQLDVLRAGGLEHVLLLAAAGGRQRGGADQGHKQLHTG
jgi:hypothetical protein